MSDETDDDKVVDIFSKPAKPQKTSEDGMSFDEVVKKNAETKERLRKERLKANKGVIRSYRLHKKDK